MLIINLVGVPDMFFLKHALLVSVVARSCLSTQRFATAIVPQNEGMMKFLFPFSFSLSFLLAIMG
jgi:hypothetical protein